MGNDKKSNPLSELARHADDLTPAWATRMLRATLNNTQLVINDVQINPLGTGQMSQTLQLALTYASVKPKDAPNSLIVKLASPYETTRTTGSELGLYKAEICFYRDIAARISVATPRCYAAVFDEQSSYFTLALEDLSHTTTVGNVLTGGTIKQAKMALRELARMQASCWNSEDIKTQPLFSDNSHIVKLFASYTDTALAFNNDLGDLMGTAKKALIEKAMPGAPRWLTETPGPLVIQHADYRLDNLLFNYSPDNGVPAVTVVDWQTMRLGAPLVDVAYYLSGCLSVDDRRNNEKELLLEYLECLTAAGVPNYSWDQLWHDYRRASLYGLFMGVSAYSLVSKSERGKEIFSRSVSRRADLILDIGGDEFLT